MSRWLDWIFARAGAQTVVLAYLRSSAMFGKTARTFEEIAAAARRSAWPPPPGRLGAWALRRVLLRLEQDAEIEGRGFGPAATWGSARERA